MALAGRVPLQQATSLFVFEKDGKVQNLLHALKYQGQQNLGVLMGHTFYKDLKKYWVLSPITLMSTSCVIASALCEAIELANRTNPEGIGLAS